MIIRQGKATLYMSNIDNEPRDLRRIAQNNRARASAQVEARLKQMQEEYDKNCQESQEEIDEHKQRMAERAQEGNDLLNLIEGIILRGLEIRLQSLLYVTTSNASKIIIPTGREGREFMTKRESWLAEVEGCITKWRKYRWGYLQKLIRDFNYRVVSDGKASALMIGDSPLRTLEKILDELRCIVPQVRILTFKTKQRIRQQLTGDELNHAEQLLEIEGQHEEAILRAAGVIAGVVLENHLASVVHQQNAKIPEAKDQYDFSGTNAITAYADWLIKQGIILPTENKPLVHLSFIRNCCTHAPGGNLRIPTRDDVDLLIRSTRKYVQEISIEPEATQ